MPPVPSNHEGMGSVVLADGTAFRVWAPFASQVEVVFYDSVDQEEATPTTATLLAPEDNGYWSVNVDGVGPDRLYRYRIANRDTEAVFTKIDPYAKEVTNSAGKAVVRQSHFAWTDGDFRVPDYNSLVIYELHLGTFDDDPGNQPGNLSRATSRLEHLAELGVNCVHLMPPNEFAADFSWGFNVALPFAIESAYGGLVEFKKLVDRAHQLGIAVMTDCVFNHFGPGDLDKGLGRFDGWHRADHDGIYFYNDDRAFTAWGPRPDFGREEVRRFIRDYVMFLLGECHCDGVRVDSTSNIWGFRDGQGWNPDGFGLLRWIADEKNHFHRYPRNKMLIAEDWHNDGWVTRSTSEQGAGMDAEWHWFVHVVRHALTQPTDEGRDMHALAGALSERFNADAFGRVIYTESHDESGNAQSLAREIHPQDPDSWFARKRTALGAVLTLTAPGIPMIWQGQEIHSTTKFTDHVPLDWDRKSSFRGVFDLYRDLCRLRRNWHNNTRGLRGQYINCHLVDDLNKVIAYHRWADGGPGDDVVILLNFSDRSWSDYRVGLPRGGVWWCRLSSDWSGYGADYGNVGGRPVTGEAWAKDGMGYSAGFAIGPYSALVLSQ